MTAATLSSEFGLVVRRAALEEHGLSLNILLEAMEVIEPLALSDTLVSFGPHFGPEAAAEFSRRLESLGLVNIDDFFVFSGDFPAWCGFSGYKK